MPLEVFERMVWEPDRMLLDGLVFRLEHFRDDETWELGEECFNFLKIEPLVAQYERYLSGRDFRPSRVFELGIWDGGSIAFWQAIFHPRRHVAVDLADREDSGYFRRYVESRGLAETVATYWRVDQADKLRLLEIAAAEFDGPLDLVVDDCSHLYEPTKASFEALFPVLRPGGLYVIEDWAWSHWGAFQEPGHEWADSPPLTRLVVELVEATGSSPELIASLATYPGFIVVERGTETDLDPETFRLDDRISRRPQDEASARSRLSQLLRL